MCHSSQPSLSRFSIHLGFHYAMTGCGFSADLSWLGFSEILEAINFFLLPNWENFSHYFFKYLVLSIFSLLFSWDSNYTMLYLLILFLRPWGCKFFSIISSCSLICITSNDFEFSNSFFCHMNSVLIPFSGYFLSYIVFFIFSLYF